MASMSPEHISEIEWRRCICRIACNQKTVKPFGFDNISTLLSRLCLGE